MHPINVRWGYFDLNNIRLMRFEAKDLQKYEIKFGDIVMCEGGEHGRCAIWKDNESTTMFQKTLHRIRSYDFIDNFFLYYFFLNKGKQNGLAHLFTGATIKHLTKQDLAKLEVDFPSLSTQKRIAEILSNYDDLIDNNNRRISLLEEAVHLLYREWFVRLRFPGHEEVAIVDGVPEGWERVTIEDLYRTSSGGTPSRKKAEYFDGGSIPWIKTQELNDSWILDTEEKITEAGLKNSSAKLFPSKTFIVAMYGATIGKFCILSSEFTTNQACCALLKKDNLPFGHEYLFGYFLSERTAIISRGQGSAQPNISQQVIKSLEIFKPSLNVIESYNSIVEPWLAIMLNLQRQNQKLKEARDALLPRLMSGTINV